MKLAMTWTFWRLSSLDLDNAAIAECKYLYSCRLTCRYLCIGKYRDFSWRLDTLTIMKGRALDQGANMKRYVKDVDLLMTS